MKNFEDIQTQWQKQNNEELPENGSKKILEKTNQLKQKQYITNAVLALTLVVLMVFFFYVQAYNQPMATLGLGLMILSLVIRIGIELLSISRLKKINYILDFKSFKLQLKNYYKKRLNTHYIFTPIILFAYVVGFLILMPFFKESLSKGFYIYIQVSAIVIFVLGTYLIFREIRKETTILKSLTE